MYLGILGAAYTFPICHLAMQEYTLYKGPSQGTNTI